MKGHALTWLALVLILSTVASPQATVSGTVFDSLRTKALLAGATVVIPELARYATADARGRFKFDSVPEGPLTLTFLHASLDSLDLAAEIVPISVPARGVLNVRLTTPSLASVLARLCPSPRDISTGVVLGRVRDIDSAMSIAGAVVTAQWSELRPDVGQGRIVIVQSKAVSNASGAYVLCGVPLDVGAEVAAHADGFETGPIPVTPDSLMIARLNIGVSRSDSGAQTRSGPGNSTGTSARLRFGTASVSGRVRAADGRPLSATVSVFGAENSTHSDDSGRFHLGRLPAGTRALRVRAIGSEPTIVVVDLRTGATVDTTVTLDRKAQPLAQVTVVNRAPVVDKTGFAERMHRGLGHYLTDADIERRPAIDLIGLLERLPGLHVQLQMGPGYRPITKILMRGGRSSNGRTLANAVNQCVPSFYLDGAYYSLDQPPMDPMQSLRNFVRPEDIKGIEVYTPSQAPPQFDRSSTTACGSIVIWTK
jgi:hypothetical protein